jgi:hypothetical protein
VRIAVTGTYTVSERALDFGDVGLSAADPIRRTVRFLPTGSRLLGVRAECDWIESTVSPTAEGADVAVEVSRGHLDAGVSYAGLLLLTDDPDRPMFRISVRANGVSELMPAPLTLYLRRDETAVVRFRDRDMQEAHLRWPEPQGPGVTTEILPNGCLAITTNNDWKNGARVRVRARDDSGRAGFVSAYAIVD